MARTRRAIQDSTAPNSLSERKRKRLVDSATAVAEKMDNKMFSDMYLFAVQQYIAGNDAHMRFLKQLKEIPVPIEEFIDSPEFLGATDLKLWPEVRKAVIELNQNWWKGGPDAFKEALLMGATSTGKSEIAKVTTAYHLHILGCMKNPQQYYGLPKATTIVFIIQAAKPHVTKKVIYAPLRNYIENMPWFQRNLRPNKLIESEMFFDDLNILVSQGGSDSDAVLGDAIIGSIIDEINFMNVVRKSKKAEVSTGRAGVYDQAQNVHDTVTRRKKGRFLSKGPMVGIIIAASSTRYRGDFTDKRKQQVVDSGEKGVFIYDKAQYKVWPQDRYSGETFRLLVENDAAADIRILSDEDRVRDGATVLELPIEYYDDFAKDPPGAMRDVVGTSVNSISPFFRRRVRIAEAVQRGEEKGLKSFLFKDNVILANEGMPQVKREHFCKNPSRPRYVHIDLSANGDRCGIAMVRFDGLQAMKRRTGEIENLPTCTVEMAVTIEPDHSNEIDLAEIRAWVNDLRRRFGYPIRAVTYDGWNSLESRQQWRRMGMSTRELTVDRRPSLAYKALREAFNDGRITMYSQPVIEKELYDLEYDGEKEKVDHPPNGGKDGADAVCGAYYSMVRHADSWTNSEGDMSGRADGDRVDDPRHD